MTKVWLACEQWWTRLRPIRTVAEVELEVAVAVSEPGRYAQIRDEAQLMRKLGMSMGSIARAFGVDEKTVRRALSR